MQPVAARTAPAASSIANELGAGVQANSDSAQAAAPAQSVCLAVVGGGSPSVSLNSTQFGGSTLTPLTTTAATVWID